MKLDIEERVLYQLNGDFGPDSRAPSAAVNESMNSELDARALSQLKRVCHAATTIQSELTS